eukprot:3815546-Prymnesium_polylepis.1
MSALGIGTGWGKTASSSSNLYSLWKTSSWNSADGSAKGFPGMHNALEHKQTEPVLEAAESMQESSTAVLPMPTTEQSAESEISAT